MRILHVIIFNGCFLKIVKFYTSISVINVVTFLQLYCNAPVICSHGPSKPGIRWWIAVVLTLDGIFHARGGKYHYKSLSMQ